MKPRSKEEVVEFFDKLIEGSHEDPKLASELQHEKAKYLALRVSLELKEQRDSEFWEQRLVRLPRRGLSDVEGLFILFILVSLPVLLIWGCLQLGEAAGTATVLFVLPLIVLGIVIGIQYLQGKL